MVRHLPTLSGGQFSLHPAGKFLAQPVSEPFHSSEAHRINLELPGLHSFVH